MNRTVAKRRPAPKWSPRLDENASSKYAGIFEALVTDIAKGRLRAGDRLPAQRNVAYALGVDLTTVTKAYRRAKEAGIVEGKSGGGTYVSLRHAAPPHSNIAMLDLSKNSPPMIASIELRQALAREVGQAIADGDIVGSYNYQDTGGSWANRAAGAKWLARRIPVCPIDRVVLSSGSQSALFAICRLLCRNVPRIAVGQFAYPGIHTTAAELGIQLLPVAMDADGLIPEALEEVVERTSPPAIYLTPTIDNPTTATVPLGRRERIVAIARRNAIALVEDDPYSALLAEPPVPFAALAPDLTWHLATLSKAVTPAMRIGYVVAPSADAAQQLSAALQAMTMMASPLFATLASRWVHTGFIAQTASAIREENRARQEMAARIFAGMQLAADPAGPHVWLSLPVSWHGIDFAYSLQRAGVMILPSASFSPTAPSTETIRISLGAAPDKRTLEQALTIIRKQLDQPRSNVARGIV